MSIEDQQDLEQKIIKETLCPFCGGKMVQTEKGYEYCENCGYIEIEVS